MKFAIILLSTLLLQTFFNMLLFSEDTVPCPPPADLYKSPTYSPFINQNFCNLILFGYAGKPVYLLSDVDFLSMDDPEVMNIILNSAKTSIETSHLKIVNAFLINNNLTIIMSDEAIYKQKQGPLEYYNYQISKP